MFPRTTVYSRFVISYGDRDTIGKKVCDSMCLNKSRNIVRKDLIVQLFLTYPFHVQSSPSRSTNYKNRMNLRYDIVIRWYFMVCRWKEKHCLKFKRWCFARRVPLLRFLARFSNAAWIWALWKRAEEKIGASLAYLAFHYAMMKVVIDWFNFTVHDRTGKKTDQLIRCCFKAI